MSQRVLEPATVEKALARESFPSSTLMAQALKEFLCTLQRHNSDPDVTLEEVHVATDGGRSRVLTVVRDKKDSVKVHNLERLARLAYPCLRFDFRVLTREEISPEQIGVFKDKFLGPKPRTLYPRPRLG